MKTAVFVYEPQHVELLPRLPILAEDEERVVIACNAEIEFLLGEKNISFQSVRDMRSTPVSERLIHAGKIVRIILNDPRLSFFSYRDINFGNLFTPTLQFYLGVFLYYLDIVASTLEGGSYDHVLIFTASYKPSPAGGLLHVFDLSMMVDAVGVVCIQKNIKFTVHDFSQTVKAQATGIKRKIFGCGMAVLNVAVGLLVRPKMIRILASENWKNIESLMGELPESELLLLDRTESLKAGWKAILRNRMRFIHSDDFLSPKMRYIAETKSQEFSINWEKISKVPGLFSQATFRDFSLENHLKEVLARVIRVGGEKAIRDIEGIYSLCKRTRPQIVMVRAGVSAQTHFAVLCKVAHALGIPSLEIQHGTLYFGPESYATDRAAEYVAEYGPQVRADLKTIGYDEDHLFDVGSPRFDAYKETYKMRAPIKDQHIFQIMCISPRVAPGFWTDSYGVFDYYQSVAKAVQHIPNCSVTIKLRPVSTGEGFYREAIARAFKDVPYTIAQHESIADLFATTDVIVSCFSTVLIESLLSGKPTIYFSAGIATYELLAGSGENAAAINSGGLQFIRTVSELTAELKKLSEDRSESIRLVAAADAFMEANYSFDGESALRLADVIRKLAQKPQAD